MSDAPPRPTQLSDVEIARRIAEGWRWGWQLNLQIKTDPALNPFVPAPGVPVAPAEAKP